MITIRNEAKGAVLTFIADGEKGHVYVTELIARIWDDYIHELIDASYTRGLLADLQFTDAQIFHMLEQLQVGRREYNNEDYRENAYI